MRSVERGSGAHAAFARRGVKLPRRLPQACLAIAAALLAAAPAAAEQAIDIDTPRAGWRTGTGKGANFSQQVTYPAVAVSTPGDQADSARIRGRIHTTPKEAGPARLVVNGVAMPLKVGPDGSFDRPYIFPPGSNGVEVRDPDRTARRRVQFYNNGSGETPARLRVLLSWDSDGTDLDLHVISPDGAHAWYGNRSVPNGGALDVDVTTGYGPEIFATPAPLKGTYLVYVNYYGGGYRASDGEAAQDLTTATITVVSQEGTAAEKQETAVVPMRAPGELTLVKRFSYP